uniref:ANK_REP_REGION domain-containing protein n=1 Tax=Steinernema glaseri TaxID=37863 RepID=A0A1I8ANS5_9BILA
MSSVLRIPQNSPAYRYTILMSLPEIYKGCEIEELLIKQKLETRHGMHLLILSACKRKDVDLLEMVLRKYIAALLVSNLWCHKAERGHRNQDTPSSSSERQLKRARLVQCQDTSVYFQHPNRWNESYPSLGQLIRWIVEAGFAEALPKLEQKGLFTSFVHTCTGTTGDVPYDLYTKINKNASVLSHFVVDIVDRWRPDDVTVLMKLLKVDSSAVVYSVFHKNCHLVLKHFMLAGADVSVVSEKNPLRMADIFYIAAQVRPRIVPVLLKCAQHEVELSDTVLLRKKVSLSCW